MIPQFSSALLDTQSSHTQVKLGLLIKKKKMSVSVCDLCSAQLTHPDHY